MQNEELLTVRDILDDDYGCEELPLGAEPMVTVILTDDHGAKRSLRFGRKAKAVNGVLARLQRSEPRCFCRFGVRPEVRGAGGERVLTAGALHLPSAKEGEK